VSAKKSVVLVTVDCLRADHVGFGGYVRPTTPFLDGLAAESFVVPAAIVAGAPTYYSFPAILGARSPLALGRDILGLAPTEPTLASELKQAGYATAAFSAANPYISSRFGYDQGFDVFRDLLDHDLVNSEPAAGNGEKASATRWTNRLNRSLEKASRKLGPAARIYDELYFQYCQHWAAPPAKSLDSLRRFPAADVIVDQARSWLASVGQQPFFLWLHLMDPHAPYYPTRKALELMGQGAMTANRARYLNSFWQRCDLGTRGLARHRDDVVALYDAGIRWVDAQMARLIDALQRFGQWDHCIFALTGDHGEEFLDHGGRYHPPARLMEELIRVPLLLRVPDAAKKELTRSPFSLVDLSPTLMAGAQVSPTAASQGKSRWQQIQQGASWDEPAVVECIAGCTNPFHSSNRLGPRVLAIRETRYKLVLDFEPAGERLYDLEADPRELAPLVADAEKPVRRRLLQWAREHVERSQRNRDPALLLRARLGELRLEWAKPMHPSQTAGF
jgi:arylsulfatase A-like enzyme